jgi:hypothetical protein
MHLQIHPSIPYALGAVLVLFGSLRAIHLGWQRRDQQVDEEGPRQKQGPRYHMTVGLLWVAMGLFLVITTYVQSRR